MIPLADTTITVTRVESADPNFDPYSASPPTPTTVASGVRAVISPPSASVKLSGGDRVVYTAQVRCDPCDIEAGDTVTDASGTVWTALWAQRVTAVGLDFTRGELRLVTGAT